MNPLLRNHPARYLLTGLALSLSLLGMAPTASAEGSRELVQNGGDRPFTEWKTTSTGGLLRRTLLNVYAEAGETIHLGSSGMGVGNGNILLFNSTANVDVPSTALLDCLDKQPTKGKLTTRVQELAGPLAVAAGGYDSCTYTPTVSGIYQVVFYGPSGVTTSGGTGNSGDPGTVNGTNYVDPPLITSAQNASVAMWDITVTNGGTEKKGRVFTDYIAMIMGQNGRSLNSQVYILTKDGYEYQTRLRGLDPNGFIFFANDQGLLYNSQPLYHSDTAGSDNTIAPASLTPGVTIDAPVHKTFFNPPDPTAKLGLSIPTTATAPAPATNFLFQGGLGGTGIQTPQGVGGTFKFDAPQTGSYQIIIDTNNDGVYDPTAGDRILEGTNTLGTNSITWDGKNGASVIVPPLPGNATYRARIILKGGEYHFPLLDAETNANGFTITMLNPPGGVSAFANGSKPTTIYFDENNYTVGSTSVMLGCNSPQVCDGRKGIDSAVGAHNFPSNYGDKKAIDTWIYFPSDAVTTPLVITVTDVKGTKSVKFLADNDSNGKVTVGDRVQYTITYTNLAPYANGNALNFVIKDTLPSQLTFVSAAITAQTAGNTIILNPSYVGAGNLTNSSTLRLGDTITITITATINNTAASGTPISNQAAADFKNFGETTVRTSLTDADAAGSTTSQPAVGGAFTQTTDDSVNTGNDSTNTADDDPTIFNVFNLATGIPKLRLVKRVSAINVKQPNGTFVRTAITDFNDLLTGAAAPDDNASGWPATTPLPYLQGAFDAVQVPAAIQPRPNDEVEYTIYFLSDGNVNAQSVILCDFVPNNSTYVANTLQEQIGTAAVINISDVIGGADTDGGFYATAPFSGACSGTNNGNGAVLVNVGTVANSTGAGAPATSYGFIRFRAKVN
jgi:fimbrial isopeptide formation D2 family protein/uncharacterized repeat protein (TIGR01451 family)